MWKNKQLTNVEKVKRIEHDMVFADYIRLISERKLSENGDFRVKTRELSERVGIDYEMFRKILNKHKPNQPRDCIIASCAALFCSVEETNKALFYYDDMPGLDATEGCRDYFIIQALEGNIGREHDYNYISKGVESVNNTLDNNKFSLLRLSNKTKSIERQIVLNGGDSSRINWISSEKFSNREEYHSSLSEFYKPYNYGVSTVMEVELNGGIQYLSRKSNRSSIYVKNRNDLFPKILDEQTKLFIKFSSSLNDANLRELKKCYEILYDTRNWGLRKCAKLKDEGIVVYCEKFNYNIPERNEYFYAEIKDGIYTFSICESSMFMKEYLSINEFKQYYSHKKRSNESVVKTFHSLEEIKEFFKKMNSFSIELQRSYLANFISMKSSLEELHDNLKNRKEFIRNFNDIFGDEPNMIYIFFDVQKEFDCIEEELDIVCRKKDAVFEFEDKKITLSREDLIVAFELGIDDIEEVISLKIKHQDLNKIYK